MREKANNTFTTVHAFYKGGEKSDNKKYEGNNLSPKQLVRNSKQPSNNVFLQTKREEVKNKTPQDIGHFFYTSGFSTGNCGEMACVALYVAELKGVPKDQLKLMTHYTKHKLFGNANGFGHSYALLGPDNGEQWVIDPWANICCDIKDYAETFKNKMDAWTAEGKRIGIPAFMGGANWLPPNDSHLATLLDAKEVSIRDYEQAG
jgi:hypothetical protein